MQYLTHTINKTSFSKLILSLSFVVSFASNLFAQVYPVQVITEITPPYSVYLSDYTTPGTSKLAVNILLTDVSRFNYPVKLRLVIEGESGSITTTPSYMPEQIILDGGSPVRLTGDELASYFNPQYLDFKGYSKERFMQTGALPEGIYRIGFQVLDYNKSIAVSTTGSATAWLVMNDPPIFNTPEKNVKLNATEPQNILFQWMPRHLGSPNSAFNAEYTFQLYEIWPDGRNPNEVVASTQPLIEVTSTSTTYIYSNTTETALIPGKQYAYRVQARDVEGRDLFRNKGYSEVQMFTYGDPCNVPTQIEATSTSSGRISINWEPSTYNTAFNVQYREAGNAESAWYPKTTFANSITIDNLRPQTRYEYQVQGQCGTISSELSEILSVTTQAKKETKVVCGSEDQSTSITSTRPLTSLLPGDIITCGKFEAQVTKASGGGGKWTGEGFMHVPFMGVKVRVTFTDVIINDKFQVTKGRIVSVFNPESNFIVQTGGTPPNTTTTTTTTTSGNQDTTSTVNVTSPIDTIVTTTNGDILIITDNGDTTTVHTTTEGNTVVISTTGDTTTVKEPITIVDPSGNTTVIDGDGNTVNSGINTQSSSSEGPIAPYLTDFYLVFIVKNIPLNTQEFYYYSSKDIVDVNVVEKLRNVYSTTLLNAGIISEGISELKRSDGIITGNDELNVMYIRQMRIIKDGNVFKNTLDYFENKIRKQYSCLFRVNGNIELNPIYSTTKISEDKTLVLNVTKSGVSDYKEALTLKIMKLQQREYVVTFDGKSYINNDKLIFEQGKQNLLKLMEKEPSGNLKTPTTNEVTWNSIKIVGSNEYNLTVQNDGKLVVAFKVENNTVKLSFDYKVEESFTPGINIDYDKKSDEYSFISKAQEKIKKKNNSMYTFLEGKSITIKVAHTKDGITAGEAGWNNHSLPSEFKFDPKTLKFDGSDCIIGPIIISQIVVKSKIDELKEIIEKGNIPTTDIYKQIKLANPIETQELEEIIKGNSNTELLEELKKSKFYAMINIYRAVTDEEILTKVIDPKNGSVTLYTDWLNEPDNGCKKEFITSGTPPEERYCIQYNYTRKLAHELMHLYYQANNKVEWVKWYLMRVNTENTTFNTKLCDDFSDESSYNSFNCSKGLGHEKNNPEGHSVCAEEFNYKL